MREARGAEVLRVHELTGLPLEMLLNFRRPRPAHSGESGPRTSHDRIDRKPAPVLQLHPGINLEPSRLGPQSNT